MQILLSITQAGSGRNFSQPRARLLVMLCTYVVKRSSESAFFWYCVGSLCVERWAEKKNWTFPKPCPINKLKYNTLVSYQIALNTWPLPSPASEAAEDGAEASPPRNATAAAAEKRAQKTGARTACTVGLNDTWECLKELDRGV